MLGVGKSVGNKESDQAGTDDFIASSGHITIGIEPFKQRVK